MLTLYRRHLASCPHHAGARSREAGKVAADEGRAWTRCSCPIWADGELNGKDYRKTLGTRDWQRAIRIAERLERPMSERTDLVPCAQPGCPERVESGRCEAHTRTVARAVEHFHEANPDLAHGTKLKYKRTLSLFEKHATAAGIGMVDGITLQLVEAFRTSRSIGLLTWMKELQILRLFLRYCGKHGWILGNPAAEMPTPKNAKMAGNREPYSPNEVVKILAACESMGRAPYERLRARAMILVLRYTALRISDVALLKRDRIRGGEIYLRTVKNDKVVKLPVHPDLQAALDALPLPRGASGAECPYYFWSGHGTGRSMVRDATRTLTAVFKESGVPNACAHRFRHTLASEVLGLGGTMEEAADILGDSAAIVRKHYAKWTAGRQARIDDLMGRLWGRPEVHQRDTRKSLEQTLSTQ